MDEFISRIGLGCSRLAGGVAEGSSRRLVEAAMSSGVRYFDTAPSYGGGRAEEVLGRALAGVGSDVRVSTKVGLPRLVPSIKGEVRSVLVGAVRRLMPQSVVTRLRRREQAPRPGGQRHYGRFDPDFVRLSLEQSAVALRRDALDAVLLHEPRLSDPPAETRDLLDSMLRQHRIGRLGAGTARGSGELPPFGSLAQCTVEASLPPDGRQWIVHGLMREFDFQALQQALARSGLLVTMPSLANATWTAQRAAGLLLCAVLLGTAPARVLVSTHSPQRLQSLLRDGGELFGELTAQPVERVVAPLAHLVREYLACRRSLT